MNPFFALAPVGLLPVFVVLATAATIIASQATISGAFSVTRQAVQLDLLPRVTDPADLARMSVARSTCPSANMFMFIAVVGFVLGVPVVERAVGRVRRRGHRHDADHDGVSAPSWRAPRGTGRVLQIVAVFGVFLLVDVAFLLGNVDEDRERRLGAAARSRR